MLKGWKLYQNCLSAHPVKTQINHFWYSMGGIGDIAAHKITYSRKIQRFHQIHYNVFGPISGISFFSYLGFASGKNLVEAKEGIIKRGFGTTNGRRSCIWTSNPIHTFPIRSAYVSAPLCQHENAPWKKKNISHLFLLLKTSNQSRNAGVCCLIR
ncbi:hypothetical protein C5167_004976 [Papaver somniferum]|uniref:Uncharacterized protein n=1 Tax=Papaver somniferum TaxID=3469 RepID=A0A4Y7JD40_PAPSO|nr:hypothetical protein C5167_004976 [Papaver somniferum]